MTGFKIMGSAILLLALVTGAMIPVPAAATDYYERNDNAYTPHPDLADPAPAPQQQSAETRPAEVAACLCGSIKVQVMNGRRQTAERNFAAARARIEALDRQLAASRNNVDVNQPDQVDAYRRLVEARESAQTELFDKAEPRYSQVTASYNAAVEAYNARCAGRPLDGKVVERVKQDLSCP